MTLMGVLGTVQAFSPVFALYAVCRVLIGSLMFGFFAAATLLREYNYDLDTNSSLPKFDNDQGDTMGYLIG